MKIVLATMCAAIALFAGGCTIFRIQSLVRGLQLGERLQPGLLIIPLVLTCLTVLNALEVAVISGVLTPRFWAFDLLATLEAFLALFFVAAGVSLGLGRYPTFWYLILPVSGLLLLKSMLTLRVARRLRRPPHRG